MKGIDIKENLITNRQLVFFLVQIVVGVGFLSIGRSIATVAGPGGWIDILVAGLIWSLGIYLMSRLAQMYPERLIFDYIQDILGKFMGNILVYTYFIYLLVSISMVMGQFVIIINNYLLPRTPEFVLTNSMLLVIGYMAEKKLKNIGRLYEHLFFALAPIFAALIPAVFNINRYNLFFEMNSSQFLQGIPVSLFSLAGLESFLIVYPFVKNKKNITILANLGLGIIVLTYIFVTVVSVGYFGQGVICNLIWPTIALLKTIRVIFLGRMEFLFIFMWVIFGFTTMGGLYYLLVLGIQQKLRLKEQRKLNLVFIQIIFILSVLHKNILQIFKFSSYIGYAGGFFGLIMPGILLTIAKIKDYRSR